VIEAYTALVLLLAVVWVVGTAVHALAGVDDMPWVAPVSGLALVLAVSAGATSLPGQGSTTAFTLAAVLAAAVAFIAYKGIRPLFAGAAPTLAITVALSSLPFIANWRVGPLGASFNDDLAPHLAWADALRVGNGAIFETLGDYPRGPHGLVAALATLSGTDAVAGFTALLLATPALTAVAALTVLQTQPFGRRIAASVAVGLAYLPIAYFAQGAFKEPLLGLLIVAFALVLQRTLDDAARRARHSALLGLLGAGAVSSYGYPGTFPLVGAAALTLTLMLLRRKGRIAARTVRDLVVLGGVAAAVLVIALLPQLTRLLQFAPFEASETPGNVPERISVFAALGIWRSSDFRFKPADTFEAGVLAGVAAIAFLYGVLWFLKRQRLALPATAAATLAIWAVANETESPYVSAKVLVIAAPTVLLITASALVDFDFRASPMAGFGRSVMAGALLAAAISSGILVLRSAHVGPLDHAKELKSLRGLLGGTPTLFLGQDDFASWALQHPRLSLGWNYTIPNWAPLGVRKPIADGVPTDFDSIEPASLDTFRYVVTVRTSYASSPPSNWSPVRRTPSYVVWLRNGPTKKREILAEGGAPGAQLDCTTPEGRRLRFAEGVAGVRQAPVAASTPWIIDGVAFPPESFVFARIERRAERRIDLPRGEWSLSLQYTSPVRLTIESKGFRADMPANLDRLGPYWELGKLRTSGATKISVRLNQPPFDFRQDLVGLGGLVATRTGEKVETIPLGQACGRYVDWYRLSRLTRAGKEKLRPP
jgi:hypothetical protein